MVVIMGNGVKLRINGDEIKITLSDGKSILINAEGELEKIDDFKGDINSDSYRVLKDSVEELRL